MNTADMYITPSIELSENVKILNNHITRISKYLLKSSHTSITL
jgi:hypothetical protein